VVANDEHGVGLNSVHAERAGRTLEDNNTLVFHVRDGKVTEVCSTRPTSTPPTTCSASSPQPRGYPPDLYWFMGT
jgi:hypothetical protein